MTPSGVVATLHAFSLSDAYDPEAALTWATDGRLYGTTSAAGVYGYGTPFSIAEEGLFATRHDFSNFPKVRIPAAPLIQAASGDFHGAI